MKFVTSSFCAAMLVYGPAIAIAQNMPPATENAPPSVGVGPANGRSTAETPTQDSATTSGKAPDMTGPPPTALSSGDSSSGPSNPGMGREK